jgi:uncharacterized protein (DUF342 family)
MNSQEPEKELTPTTSENEMTRILDSFKIELVGPNRWNVCTTFKPKENQRDAIPLKLRKIKGEIARRFHHPEMLLKYAYLKKKEMLEDGNLYVEFEIERLPIPTGVPNLTFESILTDTGVKYDNMICFIDLFPNGADDTPITIDEIKQILENNNIAENLIQWEILTNRIATIQKTLIPLHKLEVARGTIPSKGKESKLIFTFPLKPNSGYSKDYLNARKVKQGAVLCTKTPPTIGDKPGVNIKGETLQPRKGWDILLVADSGTCISKDNLKITAESDGLVTARKKETALNLPEGRKIMTEKISFRVEALLVLTGKKPETLTTDAPIEVTGTLKTNSHLISRSEIHIQGNVEQNSQVEASGDITVGGDIDKGILISDSSILSEGVITESQITAQKDVNLSGPVVNSQIRGRIVELGEVTGTNIQARHRVMVSSIGSNKTGKLSQVNIGQKAFLKQRIEDNEHFIDSANKNLKRLYDLFGHENLESFTAPEREKILIRILHTRKTEGRKPYSASEVAALKQLLGSVATLKQIVQEKGEEIRTIQAQMDISDNSTKLFIVKNRVTAKTLVTIGDYQTELEPTESGVCVRSDERGISVENLPAELDSIESLLEAFEAKEGTISSKIKSDTSNLEFHTQEPEEPDLEHALQESETE